MTLIAKTIPALLLALLPILTPATLEAAPPAPVQRGPDGVVMEKVVMFNAKIEVGDGTVIDGGSILIEDGKITRIETTKITGVGANALLIDLQGKLVTPGLIAADTSIGLVEIGAEDSTHDDVRQGSSAIKAGYDPASAVSADSSLIAVQVIEGVTSAAVAPRGGLISGGVAWIDLLAGDHVNIVAAPRVAVAANFGRDHAGSRAACLAHLREAFEDAKWYRDNQKNHERNQSRQLVAHPNDLRALWPVLDRKIPLVVRADRASDLLALIELGASLSIDVTIIGAAEGWKVANELAAAKVIVVIQPTENLPGSFDTLGARLDNAKLLDDAGVTVAIAHFDSHNVRNVTQEAGIAVANGLSHDAAIRAITLNVAKAYGMAREYGSIAPGKVANLVVWDGPDPLELSTWAEQVWVRGTQLEMKSRQTQLRDRYMDLDAFAD